MAQPARQLTGRALPVLALVVFLTAAWLVVTAAPAGAHATLTSSSPFADTVLDGPPGEVVLRFDEAVSTELGAGIRVFGPGGGRVERGTAEAREGGATLAVPVEDAGVGTYTVAWKVVSSDSHVLSGAFVYHVGEPAGGGLADLDPSRRGLDVAAWFSRWGILAGGSVAGGIAALRLALGRDTELANRRVAVAFGAAAAVLVLGATGRLLLQVADTSGRSVLDAWRLAGEALADTRAGQLDLLRIGGGFVALGAAFGWWRAPGRLAAGAALAGVTVVAVANALGGHAWTTDGQAAAVTADLVHQAAVAIWVGGLVALALVPTSRAGEPRAPAARSRAALAAAVAPTGAATAAGRFGATAATPTGRIGARANGAPGDGDDGDGGDGGAGNGAASHGQVPGGQPSPAARSEARPPGGLARPFSVLAVGAVVAVAASGVVNGWLQVGGAEGLWGTAYGRTLLAKVAAFAAMIALGWWNRSRLGDLAGGASRQVRAVRVEALLGGAALGLTAGLVALVPGRELAARPYSETFEVEAGTVSVTVEPARAGTNALHLYFFDDAGRPRPVDAAEARVAIGDLPPRRVDVTPITASHFSASGISLPTPGRWRFTISTVTRGEPAALEFEVLVR